MFKPLQPRLRWRTSGRFAGRIAALCCLLCAALSSASVADDPSQLEYRVKAAFLYNFARFVEWPADASPRDRIVIGVYGNNPFGESLQRTVEGKLAKGLSIEILAVSDVRQARDCDLLFVGLTDRKRLAEVLDALAGDPVLTVGESRGFTERGGIVNFVIEQGRVRVDVNIQSARTAGLKISSQLLRVARRVEGAEGQGR